MAKYKEIVSMVLDELKVTSDDSIFTEGHIIFLARIYRSFLLKQRYSTDLKKVIPESNYQTLCLDLEKVPAIDAKTPPLSMSPTSRTFASAISAAPIFARSPSLKLISAGEPAPSIIIMS